MQGSQGDKPGKQPDNKQGSQVDSPVKQPNNNKEAKKTTKNEEQLFAKDDLSYTLFV